MSLDDDRFPMREHARLRQSWAQMEHDDTAGSAEAEEAMAREYAASQRRAFAGLWQDDKAADDEAARLDDLRPRGDAA